MMNILIAGGTGFVGKYLTSHFLKEGHRVFILGRSKIKIIKIFDSRVTPVEWEDLNHQMLKKINLLINLAGVNISEKRWSEKRKKEIIDSRLQTTHQLVSLCASLGTDSPPLFNASAIGIYGHQNSYEKGLPPPLDEHTMINYETPSDFSSKVTRLWEKETWPAKANGVRVVNMRFGIILGAKGGILSKLILPFKLFLGGKIGPGKQPISWISILDVARAIDFLYHHPEISGPINFAAPGAVTQAEFAEKLAKKLNRPNFFTMPAFLILFLFGEMGKELLLAGQHVYPKLLLHNEFEFIHPTLESALEFALLDEEE